MPKSEMATERGDLVVSVNIKYPTSLTQDEKDVLREFYHVGRGQVKIGGQACARLSKE